MRKPLFSVLLIALLLSACRTANVQASDTARIIDLQHHRYELTHINDKPIKLQKGAIPAIEFGEKLYVAGEMCNSFMGFGKLKKGILTVKSLAMTDMLCVNEELNQLDAVIVKLLENGTKVTIIDQQQLLILSNEEYRLTYRLRDYI